MQSNRIRNDDYNQARDHLCGYAGELVHQHHDTILTGFCQLRFTLHQTPSWYKIESVHDCRFDYFRFYSEMLTLLEEDELKSKVDGLIAFLNGWVCEQITQFTAHIWTENSSPTFTFYLGMLPPIVLKALVSESWRSCELVSDDPDG